MTTTLSKLLTQQHTPPAEPTICARTPRDRVCYVNNGRLILDNGSILTPDDVLDEIIPANEPPSMWGCTRTPNNEVYVYIAGWDHHPDAGIAWNKYIALDDDSRAIVDTKWDEYLERAYAALDLAKNALRAAGYSVY